MRDGQEMTDHQLQEAAREALSDTTQAQAARDLGVSTSNISLALNHETPSRYAGTLKNIIERYTDYSIESATVHRASKKS